MIKSTLLYSLIIFSSISSTALYSNPSISEMNNKLREEILEEYQGDDPENYKELLKMVCFNSTIDGLDIFYDSENYVNVGPDEIGDSDEFFARILYPCKRKECEYSNWIKNVQLNLKVQYILAKASIYLSSIDDLVYMLKKTRHGISEYQLAEILKRKHLVKNPLKIDGYDTGDVIKISRYVFNLATYSFLATMKKPFTKENLAMAKNIVINVGVATLTAYATKVARN